VPLPLLALAVTLYSAPAGDKIAGAPNPSNPYNIILPNGRTVAPVGKSVVVGMNALGVALSPDGKYAIVSNDDERQSAAVSRYTGVHGGYSLTVVDTAAMRVTDNYAAPSGTRFFLGVAALKDPAEPSQTLVIASGGGSDAIYFFHLDGSGKLERIETPLQTLPPVPLPSKPLNANANRSFPGWITISPNHRVAYVVNNLGNAVTDVDIATRRLLHEGSPWAVGYFPWAAAVSGRRLYVTNPGLSLYQYLPNPARFPQFENVAPAPQFAQTLSVLPLSPNGVIEGAAVATASLDAPPDGVQNVGGAQPGAIAISRNGRYAYICMTSVDRIAIVDLLGVPRVVGGVELRLFDKSPYGMQPNAIVMSPDGKRAYVTLAGMNAVAVLDARVPSRLHRLGLIPTGWYPTALTISRDGRYLFVANARGFGQEPGFAGAVPTRQGPGGAVYQVLEDSNKIWATLQRIDLRGLKLLPATLSTLKYARVPLRAQSNPMVPPLRSLERSRFIKHVVFILEENKTYDSMLGDLTDADGRPYGNGDPSLVSFGANVTPNLHQLARDFGLAVNFYADSEESDAGHQFAAAGIASAYSEETVLVKSARWSPLVSKNEDAEDYPRAGYIFNNAARAGLSYRDYGDLVRLTGYDQGGAADPRADDPNFRGVNDQSAPTSGLGGLYALDVVAPAALRDHIDLNYPGWNLRIRDVRRANEYIADFHNQPMPDFTYIWLPSDHGGSGPDIPPLPEEVADGDRALGAIVDFLSHQPEWDSTVIFITPDDAQSSRDHVNEHRTYAIVVSPYAKRHFVGKTHLSTVSILKTEEELLGLPALSLGDLLATDMADFFTTSAADAAPYNAIPVATQTASAEGRRIAALLEYTDQGGPDADARRSARLIALSRQADRLATERRAMSASNYAAAQQMLYAAALRAVKEDSE
jgi:DNA-binding beta-propeller fold protein YncE